MPVLPHVVGALVAAGRGRRMGATKQVLPWPPGGGADGATVVSAAFDAIAPYCQRMIVVFGHDAALVESALGGRAYRAVHSDPDAEMIESIKAGLRHAAEDETMQCVLLQPADHPEVRASTIETLIERFIVAPGRAIMPEFLGKGGHPVLIPCSLIDGILEYDGPGGLRAYWQAHPDRRLRVPIDDPDVTRDLDTPAAYGAGRRR